MNDKIKKLANDFVNTRLPTAPEAVKVVIKIAFLAGMAEGARQSQNSALCAQAMITMMDTSLALKQAKSDQQSFSN